MSVTFTGEIHPYAAKFPMLSAEDFDSLCESIARGGMRQPILIATHNAVIERAPLQGFLHQTNNLDTLGFDRRDSRCKP